MRKITTLLAALLMIVMSVGAENRAKDQFKMIASYRNDISADVIKKVKQDMGYFDYSYPAIHDSWIEHPHGRSVDLQGNVMFPDIDYTFLKPLSPTHFKIGKFDYDYTRWGVVRADGSLIVPIENAELEFYPQYNLIFAYVDWSRTGSRGMNKGKLKIYDYYGNLLNTYNDVSGTSLWQLAGPTLYNAEISITTSNGIIKHTFSRARTSYDQDMVTKFYTDGPQACTYNIIRDLCASNKKGDQKKAMDLLDYFMDTILPDDNFSRPYSSASWDATLRYLACMHFTKEWKRLDFYNNTPRSPYYRFKFIVSNGLVKEGMIEPDKPTDGIPLTMSLAQQVEPLFFAAVNEYEQKKIRDAQRTEAWLTVLGILSSTLSSYGGYAPVSSNNYSLGTTTIPVLSGTGKSMLEQTSIAPEITGAAMCAGYVPVDEVSSSTSSVSSSSSSSSSSPNRVCHACFGKGTHQACNGSGSQLAFGNKRTEKCSGCHGSGKCPQCNGLGHH